VAVGLVTWCATTANVPHSLDEGRRRGRNGSRLRVCASWACSRRLPQCPSGWRTARPGASREESGRSRGGGPSRGVVQRQWLGLVSGMITLLRKMTSPRTLSAERARRPRSQHLRTNRRGILARACYAGQRVLGKLDAVGIQASLGLKPPGAKRVAGPERPPGVALRASPEWGRIVLARSVRRRCGTSDSASPPPLPG